MIYLLLIILAIFLTGEVWRYFNKKIPPYRKKKRFLRMFNGDSLLADETLYPTKNDYNYANINSFYIDCGEKCNEKK